MTEIVSYIHQTSTEKAHIHLRIDPDGSGLLVVNASRILHLNPTAALMADLYLKKIPTDQVVRTLKRQFMVSTRQAEQDYAQLSAQIDHFIHTNGACLIHDLDLETIPPFSAQLTAPYRMDLALTYRCNNDCFHCYNARPRNYPELDTENWRQIIDRVWELGIPHIVFTGGEPTLRRDLPDLVAYAQMNGLVTGLNTNGRRLNDRSFLDQLVQSGLNHVQITLESHDQMIHDQIVRSQGAWHQTVAGIRNALDSSLYVMTNTTLLQQNAPFLEETLEFLAGLGVPTIGLNALIYSGAGASCGSGLEPSELSPLLQLAKAATQTHEQRLIWYTPTQYCHFDPMELDLGIKGCTAALYNMCVEPDGAVIPCQSYYHPLGSLLTDPWDQIWEHDLSLSLRQRHYISQKCGDCVLLSECGGGCPLAPQPASTPVQIHPTISGISLGNHQE